MGLFDKLKNQAPQQEKVAPLLDRLKEIGDQHAVNPPEPAAPRFPLTGTMCSVCGLPQYTTPSGDTCENGHGGAAPVPVPAPASKGDVCPFCKKVFVQLARHKCKGAQEAPAPASAADIRHAAPAVEPPPQVYLPSMGIHPDEVGIVRGAVDAGYILIFDALFERGVAWPGWGVVVLFTDIIAPLAAAVAKENNQEHWGAVEFGRGGSLLAAKLEKWLVATSPAGVILADSNTPELRAVKEVLKKYAKVIIQGVR